MIQAAELDSAAANKPAKRSGSTGRSRAAEVHNLSERVGILDVNCISRLKFVY